MNFDDHIGSQFGYNEWANREVLAAIRAGGADDRSLQLMAHIFSAERLWLERMQQRPPSLPVWPNADLEQCEAQAAEMAKLWREYLDGINGDFSRVVAYKNSKGESWTSTVLEILTHVVMHSSYHRGQIASHMRSKGKTPAYTDFIHGARQGLFKPALDK
jgi:uncharacterized damage-inducible protein DinB